MPRLGTGHGLTRPATLRGVVTPYVHQSHTATLVLAFSVGAFIVGELQQVLRLRPDATRSNLRAEAWFRAMFFGGILLLPLGRAVVPGAVLGGGVWLFSVGVAIGWLGLLLRWWSFASLGRYFTVVLKTSEDQPVVVRGPYKVVRHPSYAGLLLAFVGCGLMLGNWVSAASAVALVLVALLYRLRIEERALNAALGRSYGEYAATRARLVPFVW
jgi:protein-S-isoprenylcysteine O-methyltransferase Ste14